MRITSFLFIELLGGFGDLLIALPAIHALSRSYPRARAAVLTVAEGTELLVNDPYVDEVVGVRLRREEGAHLARGWVERVLASKRFDLVVSDTNYDDIGRLVQECSARRRVWNLWRRPPPDELVGDRFVRILASEGLVIPTQLEWRPRLFLSEEEILWAQAWRARYAGPDSALVVLNPGAGMPIKPWPVERFAEAGRGLLRRGDIVLGILDGGSGNQASLLASLLEGRAELLPRLGLRQLAAALSQVALFISADTGPARLAEAVGTPTIALCGPTWPGRYGLHTPNVNLDAGVDCPVRRPEDFTLQPCWYSGQCIFAHRRNCVEDIEPHAVVAVANTLLGPAGLASGYQR